MARAYSKPHDYTAAEKAFLCEHYKRMTQSELTAAFNLLFGHEFLETRIASRLTAWGVLSGRNATFKKGHLPHNKGSKGVVNEKSLKTCFKPGHLPKNTRPVGSERLERDGYIRVKVAEPDFWRNKHQVVWERAHGPVPDGYVLVFLDGERQNVVLDNLLLLPRGVVAIANKEGRVMTLPVHLRFSYWQALSLQHKAGQLRRGLAA